MNHKEIVAKRFSEADLASDRFIDVTDGGKDATNHDTRFSDARDVPGRNYGIYAGNGVVCIDIDDYDDSVDDDGLQAVLELPDTLTTKSPHTDGDPGGHRFYNVSGGVVSVLNSVYGVRNPHPSWGEVRASNQYVVGPGSELDSCDKDWCSNCKTDEGGNYEVANNGEIATITVAELLDVLEADPELESNADSGNAASSDTNFSTEPGDSGYSCHGFSVDELRQADATLDRLLTEPNPGKAYQSTSEADFAACIRLLHLGFDKSETAGIVRRYRDRDKLTEDRGNTTYLKRTVNKAASKLSGTASEPVNEGRGDDPDKIAYWKLRHTAVACDILPADGFVTKETDNGEEYIGFPGRDTYNRTLQALEAEGVDHGRGLQQTATDGGATTASASSDDGGPSLPDNKDPDLSPETVAIYAGVEDTAELHNLTDRELAHYAWELLKEHSEYHFLATFDGQMYVYESGVWRRDGEQRLREAGSRLLGPEYSKNVKDELVERVRSERGHRRDELGSPKRTVAVENGLLELARRELADHDPAHLALNKLPVEYQPDAECPRWRQFVEESVENRKQDALQEYVGYALLEGEMPFARCLLLVGGGSNGKSTFLNTVGALLGEDNITGFSIGNLAHNEYYAAQMYGHLANIDADITGGIGDGGMFKKLTGGDRAVNARRPYGEPFTFSPTVKQLFSANEVPDTDVDDDAFFRRWLIVEFPVEFTDPHLEGPDKNPDLEDELQAELPGILNWAVEGLNRLLEQGRFTNEGEIHKKRQRWQEWGDTVDKFISNCVDTDADGKHKTGEIYDAYREYCREELGETPESQSTLTGTLKKESGVKYSDNFRFNGKKARGFKGVDLAYGDSDSDDSGGQQSLSQRQGLEELKETVENHADADGLADVETVIDDMAGQRVTRDRVEHYLDKLLKKGELQEPENGRVELT